MQEQLKSIAHESPGSVEELQLGTRVMCSPGLEVEVEFAAPLALGGSVGDDDLDRAIADLVSNEAPAVEEVPEVGAERWIGESNAHGKSLASHHGVRDPRLAHSRHLTSGHDSFRPRDCSRERAFAIPQAPTVLHARARRITGRWGCLV
jgi:hypothetical protein